MIGTSLIEIIRKSKKKPKEETLDQIKKLLNSNPSAVTERNKQKQTPAHYAVKTNAPDILELLVIEYDADLTAEDKDRKKPEDFASKNLSMLNLINELKREIQRRKKSKGNHLCDLVRLAYENPAKSNHYQSKFKKRISFYPHEINEGTFQGRTACHWAAIYELPFIIEFLVQEGNADLRQKDKLGKYPLDYAKAVEIQKVISSLMKQQEAMAFKLFFSYEPEKEEKATFQSPRGLRKITQDLEDLTLGKFKRKRRSVSEPLQKSKDQIVKGNRSRTQSQPEKEKHVLTQSTHGMMISSGLSSGESSVFSVDIEPTSAAEIIRMAISCDDESSVIKCLEQKENPNNRCEDGRPYLLHAFLQRAEKCFLVLLLNEADINQCDHDSMNLLSFLEEARHEDKEKINRENLDFLISVLNKANAQIDLDKIHKAKEKLDLLDEQFNWCLIKSGLNGRFTSANCRLLSRMTLLNVAELNCYPKQLVKRIYECCSSVHFSKKNIPISFDKIEFRNKVIGLLHYQHNYKVNPSIIILDILCYFYSHSFELNQKMIALLFVKEMIRWHNFAHPRRKELLKLKLKEFFKLTSKDGFEELNDQIRKMVEQYEVILSPYIEAHHQINAILNRAGYGGRYPLKEKIEEMVSFCAQTNDLNPLRACASLFAKELLAVTLQFYQLVHPREFLNKGWVGNTSVSSNITHQQLLFNNIAFFLRYEILIRTNENERAMFIVFCIMVIEELLDYETPDYNMAMAVSAALNDNNISRLKRTFEAVPSKFLESWRNIQSTLSEKTNYRNQRLRLRRHPSALPFLGIYTRDVTFIYDGNDAPSTKKERYPLLGGIFCDLLQRQYFARTCFNQFKTDLPSLLKLNVNISDLSMYEMSIVIEPPILCLTTDFDCHYFEIILKSYIHNKQPLQVYESNELKEGAAAVKAIYEYLESLVKQRLLKVNVANHLIALACKAASDENMGFNCLSYNLRLNEIGSLMGDEVRELLTLIGSDKVKIKLRNNDDKYQSKSHKKDEASSSKKRTVEVAIEVTIKKDNKGGSSYILRGIRNKEEEREKNRKHEKEDYTFSEFEEEAGMGEGVWRTPHHEELLSLNYLYDNRRRSGSYLDEQTSREKGKEIERSKGEGESTIIEHSDFSGSGITASDFEYEEEEAEKPLPKLESEEDSDISIPGQNNAVNSLQYLRAFRRTGHF